jgi:hypothetical protein
VAEAGVGGGRSGWRKQEQVAAVGAAAGDEETKIGSGGRERAWTQFWLSPCTSFG